MFHADGESGVMSTNAVLLIVHVVSWTILLTWKFTILPALYPDEPKAFPHLIPCIQIQPFEHSCTSLKKN